MASEKEISDIIKIVAEKEGFKEYELLSVPGTIKGDNYLSIINTIEIKGINRRGETEVLNLILKSAMKQETIRENFPLREVFEREIYFYNVIYPAYLKLQTERGVAHPFKHVPKVYYTSSAEKLEAVVMENLKKKDFCLWDRSIPMNPQHVAEVMKLYGKFHALSFGLKELHGETYKKIISCLIDVFAETHQKNSEAMERELENIISFYDEQESPLTVAKLKSYKDKLETFLNYIKDYNGDHTIITHGDCWCNNFVFKYDDESDQNKPTDIRMLDFQILRPGNPVFDLSYFLYAATEYDVYKNYQDFLKIYYDSFSDHLSALGCDPETIFPYSGLLQDWKRFCGYGFNITMIILKVMLSEPGEAIDLQTSSEEGKNFLDAFTSNKIKKEDLYVERIKKLVQHLVETDLF